MDWSTDPLLIPSIQKKIGGMDCCISFFLAHSITHSLLLPSFLPSFLPSLLHAFALVTCWRPTRQGCIFAELLTRRVPFFAGSGEGDQLRRILHCLGGEPAPAAWPEYRALCRRTGFRYATGGKSSGTGETSSTSTGGVVSAVGGNGVSSSSSSSSSDGAGGGGGGAEPLGTNKLPAVAIPLRQLVPKTGYNHLVRDIHASAADRKAATTSLDDGGFALLASLLAWPPGRATASQALRSPWLRGARQPDAARVAALATAATWAARPYSKT